MSTYRHISYFISALLLIVTLGAHTVQNSDSNIKNRIAFGVKIGLLPTGGLTQYAIVNYRNGRKAGMRPVSLPELIKIGTGKWPVPGTHSFYDFFDDEGLYEIQIGDSTNQIDYHAAFDSLWKIRFVEHPTHEDMGRGWSQGDARPSLKQQAFIYNTYGVRGYDQEYFTDSSFFKLLRDVLNPEWVEHYKSLK